MAQFIRTFSEHNEHFQQSVRVWSFTEKEEIGTFPVPNEFLPFVEACVDAAIDGKSCPDFPEELEEKGVKTVGDAVTRICTEDEFDEEEEAEWTSWNDILISYYERLAQIED